MLTEIYIEALLVDEEPADEDWEACDIIPVLSWNIISKLNRSIYSIRRNHCPDSTPPTFT